MFKKIKKTQYPPTDRPIMVWDGECGFCKYWTTRWEKFTGSEVEFKPYQIAKDDFPDIDVIHFKQASRFIDKDGRVYSGPHSAYKTLTHKTNLAFLNNWYENYSLFTRFSDNLYHLVASNRGFFFKLTKFLFGSDPKVVRPFWFIYLAIIMYFMYV